jgi:hypothetical protein
MASIGPLLQQRRFALPAGWQEHRVQRRTAEELGRMDGAQQLKG